MTRKAKREPTLLPFSRRGSPAWALFTEDLRGMVWNSAKDMGKTWKDVANAADVTSNTVSRFAYRETKTPQIRTIFGIADACDIELLFRKRVKGK